MRDFDALRVPCDQRALIEASAGTGKTYAITTLFIRMLLEQQLEIERVLVVTFTEAATAELKQRVRERIGQALRVCGKLGEQPELAAAPDARALTQAGLLDSELDLARILLARPDPSRSRARLERALQNFDDAAIYTIHGFCQRMLRENAFLTRAPFDAELLQDTRPLVQEVLLDFWARQMSHASRAFVEALLQRRLTPKELGNFASFVAHTRPLRTLPEQAPEVPEFDYAALERAFANARRSWQREEVERCVLEANLNGTKYRPASVTGWCTEMDELLAKERPKLPFFDKWTKFTNAELEAGKKKESRTPRHAFFDACDELAPHLSSFERYIDARSIAFKLELIAACQSELGEKKRRLRVLSFDDLLHALHDALCSSSGPALAKRIRTQHPVALIDEFQDTDPTQYAIFDAIYTGSDAPLFMIGDPKQAIYSFRGADIFAYIDAAHAVPEAQQHTMSTNYRSAPELVQAVNLLFEQCAHPFYFEAIGYPRVAARAGATQRLHFDDAAASVGDAAHPAPLQLRFVAGDRLDASFKERRLPALVAAEVSELLAIGHIDERRVTPKDFAVLTRTNKEAFQFQAALLALGIPAVVLGDRSVFEQPEAEELELVLAAVLEPANARALRAALLTDLLGFDAQELLALESDDARWDEWANRMRSLSARWHEDGFVQMMRQLIAECRVSERLLELSDGERRMTNLLHLVELLHTEGMLSHLGPSGVLQYLTDQRHDSALVTDSEQIRLESDSDSVVLTTIHKSKGLEYPIVFCPTLHNGMLVHPGDKLLPRFHDESNARALTLYLGQDQDEEYAARMQVEAMAENLRMLYVALTRAKHRSVVHWGKFWQHERSALAYLLHAEPAGGAPAPPVLRPLFERIKKLSPEQLLATLRGLDPSAQQIGVSVCDLERRGAPYRPPNPQGGELHARRVSLATRRATPWRRTASFSSLTATAHAPVFAATPPQKDALPGPSAVDVLGELPQLTDGSATLLDGRDYDSVELVSFDRGHAGTRTELAEFPGGTRTGNFFHELLEHLDFRAAVAVPGEPAGLEMDQGIATSLTDHGLGEHHLPTVRRALVQCLTSALPTGHRLCDVAPPSRLNELEFTLPARGSSSSIGDAIDSGALGAAFAQHPSANLPVEYARAVTELRFAPQQGYLKGFVDLIYRYEERYYVVDYKTNNLGAFVEDYDAARLSHAMQGSHYVLQYHLYTLALHRYLTTRLPGYDYARDFGGCLYLFIRGMHPEHPGQGVFFDKPPRERIEALSALFCA